RRSGDLHPRARAERPPLAHEPNGGQLRRLRDPAPAAGGAGARRRRRTGTITADLAARVAPGEVVGIEPTSGPLEDARAHAAAAGVPNVTFALGYGHALA